MLGDPMPQNLKTAAGPSRIEKEDRDRSGGKSKKKVQEETARRSDENKSPKRKSGQKYQWINFYHEEGSKAFKDAKEFRASFQLLVHGLPKTLLPPTKAGTQERVLNDLMASLSQETLGEDGIDLIQENIIGAHPIEPTPRDRSPVTRITLNSRETKASIRNAAVRAGRWGNGTHSVFFRDITLEKRRRKSSDEDTNTPKRGKFEDTPKRGREPKRSRLAQVGTHLRRESRNEDRSRENRARTVGQRQKERDDRESQIIEIEKDRHKERMAKLEHQRREEEFAKEKTCDKQKPGTSNPKISPITPFRAVNEPEPTAEDESKETEDSPETRLKESSGDENEQPDSGSDSENLRSREEEDDLEPAFDLEHDLQPQEERHPLSPEREVSFTPPSPSTKNARRNFRRRRANKKQRHQDSADKKRREINVRLRSEREKAKLQNSKLRPPQTSSTDIMTDSDDRASNRNPREPKSRRESLESIEELDSKGRIVPTNKYKNRRH